MTNAKDEISPVLQFVTKYGSNWRVDYKQEGLTKREYFAAMAMQGVISNSWEGLQNPLITAQYAVKYADELIDVLNNPKL
jgi:hypothetical protein